MRDPRIILITGASSGIGAALALHYAAPGRRLLLTGRATDRLAAVAGQCRARGAQVEQAVIDVTERDVIGAWLTEADRRWPIDLAIANAGIAGGSGGPGEREKQARLIFATNLGGVLNTVHPLIPAMQARRRGQLALISSLASFRGMPGAPAYCASKAAVRVYGEALRGALARDGITVSVVCPGFISTPLTAGNPFPMPFLMGPERAVRIIARGLARGRGRIAFPWQAYWLVRLLAGLPVWLADRIVGRAPRKPPLAAGG